MNEEGQRILDKIQAERGYVLPTHEYLAEHHPEFLAGHDAFFMSAMGQPSLTKREKELILIAADICVGAAPNVVAGHVKRAIANGATEAECLAAVELAVLAASAKAMGTGIAALKEA